MKIKKLVKGKKKSKMKTRTRLYQHMTLTILEDQTSDVMEKVQ